MQSGNWQFGPFELNSSRYELLKNGRPVRIERIPMDLLILLVSRDRQLVDRKEIVDSLWGVGVHVDSEQGINTAVRKLRQILGDDPERPKFVQTVVGKGYRFVGEITRPREASPEPISAGIPSVGAPARISAPKPHVLRPPMFWIALLAGVLVVALTGSWLYLRSGNAPVVLAVLPFENLTGSSDREYLADGVTDETISLLGNLDPSQLRVIARTSVMQYKGTRKPSSQIGRELGVGLVVEGGLREENGRVRITTQLIRVRDQKRLWTNTEKDDLNPILTMQTNMASAVAESLRLHLSPEIRRVSSVPVTLIRMLTMTISWDSTSGICATKPAWKKPSTTFSVPSTEFKTMRRPMPGSRTLIPCWPIAITELLGTHLAVRAWRRKRPCNSTRRRLSHTPHLDTSSCIRIGMLPPRRVN
jgi:TolB-like protein/DNA-binding winged helix-turn-helix (wHTH) protein